MSLRYIAPLATATAAATIGLAPIAAAAPSGPINQCTSTGTRPAPRTRRRATRVANTPQLSTPPRAAWRPAYEFE